MIAPPKARQRSSLSSYISGSNTRASFFAEDVSPSSQSMEFEDSSFEIPPPPPMKSLVELRPSSPVGSPKSRSASSPRTSDALNSSF